MWWKILSIALASLIILAVIVINVDVMLFNAKVDKEIVQLDDASTLNEASVITAADLIDLPEPMQRYLRYAQVIGKNKISKVILSQEGWIKQSSDQSWMPFEAEQYFTILSPGFLWSASMKMLPVYSIKARDMYSGGKGNMYIKLPSFVTIADAKGYEIDQGSALRYLAEMVWFPTAYLNEYISYKPIDDNSCEITMDYQGITASAVLHFNDIGEMTGLTAERYREENGEYSLDVWSPRVSEYREVNGIRIPTNSEVIWKLNSGDFPCIRIEVTDIKYDTLSNK